MYVEYMGLTGDIKEGQFKSYIEGFMGGHGTQLPSDIYLQVIAAALDRVQALPNVDPSSVALMGFSLGGSYAIRTAVTNPSVSALVLYYTPYLPQLEDSVRQNFAAPTLIIHGALDDTVSVDAAHRFANLLDAKKKIYELEIYPSAGYEFNFSGSPQVYDQAETNASWSRTLAFLDKYLKNSIN
jgi:carboxymethylenebutenolidase